MREPRFYPYGHDDSWTLVQRNNKPGKLLVTLLAWRKQLEDSAKSGDPDIFEKYLSGQLAVKFGNKMVHPEDGVKFNWGEGALKKVNLQGLDESRLHLIVKVGTNKRRDYMVIAHAHKEFQLYKTPLIYQYLNMVIKPGVDVNQGHLKIVALLLRSGLDVTYRYPENQNTLLHIAAYQGDQRMIALLVAAGCPLYEKNNKGDWILIQNKAGKTVFDIAAENDTDLNRLQFSHDNHESQIKLAMSYVVQEEIVKDPLYFLIRQSGLIALKIMLSCLYTLEFYPETACDPKLLPLYQCFERIDKGRGDYDGKSLLRIAYELSPEHADAVLEARTSYLFLEEADKREGFVQERMELLKDTIRQGYTVPGHKKEPYRNMVEVFYRHGCVAPDEKMSGGKTYTEHALKLGIKPLELMTDYRMRICERIIELRQKHTVLNKVTERLCFHLEEQARLLERHEQDIRQLTVLVTTNTARVQKLEAAQRENHQLTQLLLQMMPRLLPTGGEPRPQLGALLGRQAMFQLPERLPLAIEGGGEGNRQSVSREEHETLKQRLEDLERKVAMLTSGVPNPAP